MREKRGRTEAEDRAGGRDGGDICTCRERGEIHLSVKGLKVDPDPQAPRRQNAGVGALQAGWMGTPG